MPRTASTRKHPKVSPRVNFRTDRSAHAGKPTLLSETDKTPVLFRLPELDMGFSSEAIADQPFAGPESTAFEIGDTIAAPEADRIVGRTAKPGNDSRSSRSAMNPPVVNSILPYPGSIPNEPSKRSSASSFAVAQEPAAVSAVESSPIVESKLESEKTWWDHWSSGVVLILLIIALVAASIIAFNDSAETDPSQLADSDFAVGEFETPEVLSLDEVEIPNIDEIPIPPHPVAQSSTSVDDAAAMQSSLANSRQQEASVSTSSLPQQLMTAPSASSLTSQSVSLNQDSQSVAQQGAVVQPAPAYVTEFGEQGLIPESHDLSAGLGGPALALPSDSQVQDAPASEIVASNPSSNSANSLYESLSKSTEHPVSPDATAKPAVGETSVNSALLAPVSERPQSLFPELPDLSGMVDSSHTSAAGPVASASEPMPSTGGNSVSDTQLPSYKDVLKLQPESENSQPTEEPAPSSTQYSTVSGSSTKAKFFLATHQTTSQPVTVLASSVSNVPNQDTSASDEPEVHPPVETTTPELDADSLIGQWEIFRRMANGETTNRYPPAQSGAP